MKRRGREGREGYSTVEAFACASCLRTEQFFPLPVVRFSRFNSEHDHNPIEVGGGWVYLLYLYAAHRPIEAEPGPE